MLNILKHFNKKIKKIGPGLVTGASDDDPSGIATYSIAGAQYGYKLNWLSLFLIPGMIAIQEASARIGMCSGMGLAEAIKKFYSKKILYFSVLLLTVVNIINIGADLGMMAQTLEMIIGLPFLIWLVLVAGFTIIMEVFVPYKKYYFFLKFLGLTLLVYIVTAFIVKQDWIQVARYTFIPHIEFSETYLLTMVGFVGTTISPYLFFWQASEEVEEEIKDNIISDFNEKPKINIKRIKSLRFDTVIGMVFSNLVATCIVLTTASTLHNQGITNLETPAQIALALKPLAGNFAFLLFTVGIVGMGLQSIPVLSGGVAYSLSETFGFKEGLNKKLGQAKMFYLILAIATITGALMNLIGIHPVKALFYSAILNGVISIPIILIIIKLSNDKRVVGNYITPKKNNIINWVLLIFITLSSGFMIFNFLKR